MSDLYLVLRRRLESLPEWVFIDSAILRSAREAKGFSYETMGREVNVVAKTWERYEKAGRIPRPLVPRIAQVLELEVEEPAPRRVTLEPAEVRIEALAELKDHLDGRLAEITGALTALDRKLDTTLGPRLDAIEASLRELTRAGARSST